MTLSIKACVCPDQLLDAFGNFYCQIKKKTAGMHQRSFMYLESLCKI